MYIYIIIFFLIVIVLITLNKPNKTENFENCYLNVGNTKKNGDKTYFTNNMLDNYFDRKERISGLQNTDNNTVQTLTNYKKNIFQSNDEYNKINNEFNTFNNNMDQQFNKLNNNLTSKIQEAKTLKQSAINKFNTIDTNMSKVVGDADSTLDEKLKPLVNSSINSNLDKISDNTINNINSTNMFNNRMTLAPSDMNTWKIVPGYTAPMRIDPESGNVQCLSYDGIDCDWNYIQQNGNDLSKIKTDRVKPVTCSSKDYNNPNNWCKKLNDYYSQNNIDQVDWSNCPVDWTDVNMDGNLCQAPDNYSGSCSNVSTFSNYSPQDKQSWGQGCIARWPFKTNIINTVKNSGNIPSIINTDIDKKMANISPTSLLSSFNTYSNGVYVQAYRLKSDNSRGDKIQDGIITTNVNFNWGVGLIFGIRDNSTQTDTNMIYLELTGYLKIPGNATSITFRLSSDDGSRLIFSENDIKNMKVIIDMWQSQSVNSKESSSITVSPNTYLPLQIQFFENYGSASLKLEWAINGGSYVVIPRESYYVNKEICNYKFNFKYIKEIDTKAQSLIQSKMPLLPVFNSNSNTATTTEGTYTISIWRCYVYPCYNITTSGYINGGSYGSIFDNNDSTGVDMESYSNLPTATYGFPYRIVVTLPVQKTFNGTLNMTLISPWVGCLPQNMTLNTLSMSSDLLSNQNWNSPFANNLSQSDISSTYLQTINLGQVGNANNGPTTQSWNINLDQPFNTIVFEILTGWGSAGRYGSNSVWMTSINFQQQSNDINPDIAIVKGIAPTLISMNWSPFNFSSYANSNCSCSASYRLVYAYNNTILSSPSGVNSANNCPTYCNPSLTFNLDMSNIASINTISSLKLVLQFNNGNGVWVNSVCPPMQVSKGQTSYIFNCFTTQS